MTWFGKWGYLWREWFTSVDHKKIGIMYVVLAIVMLLRGFSRRDHDADAKGALGRRQRGLPAAASLRPGLYRPRHDHDLLHGHALRHRRDELCHAASGRRARRGLSLPEQLQLLDDSGRRHPQHGVPLRGRVRAHRLARLSALSGAAYSPGVGVDYYIWSLQIAGVERPCRPST